MESGQNIYTDSEPKRYRKGKRDSVPFKKGNLKHEHLSKCIRNC